MDDRDLVTRVCYILGVLCGIALIGIVTLSVLGKEPPDALKMLATGFGTALGTILVNPRGRTHAENLRRAQEEDRDRRAGG